MVPYPSGALLGCLLLPRPPSLRGWACAAEAVVLKSGFVVPLCETEFGNMILSATDISALATMKSAAKCDTWCELQNSANHRILERNLCPRLARGRACLSVLPPKLPLAGWIWPSVVFSPGRLDCIPGALPTLATEVSSPGIGCSGHGVTCGACTATFRTSGQAGLPAEFKHITKRRKRN